MTNSCSDLIKECTKKKYITITDRGNTAIDLALQLVKEHRTKTTILIPDQGGWIHFAKAPPRFGLQVKKLKTNYGIINPEDCKDAAAILYSAYAGYFAQQDIKEIYQEAKKNNVLVILDISASYTATEIDADILVASCRKIIGAESGGFIATDFAIEEIQGCTQELQEKLQNAPARLKELLATQKKVKEDLKDEEIFHKDRLGIAVAVKTSQKVLEYTKEHNYETIRCPKNIKIEADAVVIDLYE